MAPLHSLFLSLVAASVALSLPTIQLSDSLVSLPLTRRFQLPAGQTIADVDRARARALIDRFLTNSQKRGGVTNEPITNAAVTYTTNIGIGTPATDYTLLIDTGSSNTWVGAEKKFVKTSSTNCLFPPAVVSVTYGSGSFSGEECSDTVTLAPGLVIKGQSIGIADTATGFSGVDGILGIGPVDLTAGTIDEGLGGNVPTVMDNAYKQGLIPEEVIGISFEPTTSDSVKNGELTYGGTDYSKFTGEIHYVPVTSTSPASEYWGIDQAISYGGSTLLTSSGIVDTGTTLILLATDAFNAYTKATGGVPDSTTGLLKITQEQFNELQDLTFLVGDVTYSLTPNAQIWPRSLNTVIGGTSGSIYLIVASLGSNSGQGLDFINGYTFLERFYSVFDTTDHRVGFATTPFTDATTN